MILSSLPPPPPPEWVTLVSHRKEGPGFDSWLGHMPVWDLYVLPTLCMGFLWVPSFPPRAKQKYTQHLVLVNHPNAEIFPGNRTIWITHCKISQYCKPLGRTFLERVWRPSETLQGKQMCSDDNNDNKTDHDLSICLRCTPLDLPLPACVGKGRGSHRLNRNYASTDIIILSV